MPTLVAVLGTRPEAIKFAPVLEVLRDHPGLSLETIVTGQQADLLPAMLDSLGIVAHHRLSVMSPDQPLPALLRNTVRALAPVVRALAPRAVLVQGDTTTALAGALVGSFERVPVVHIEAGLRTFDTANPYPEEANRMLVTHAATLHCAPTAGNAANLIAEGIAPGAVVLTGNPIVGAATAALPLATPSPGLARILAREAGRRIVTLTAHRRENFGARLQGYLCTVREFIARHRDTVLIAPVHPNPEVSRTMRALLEGQPRVELIEPLGYYDFLALLKASALVLSDSGGIQEEIGVVGVPLIVLREKTERPEILATGLARLARDPVQLDALLGAINDDTGWPAARPLARNPFGDGRSATRIAEAITQLLAR